MSVLRFSGSFRFLITFDSQTRTRDMGGQASTHEFTRAVLDKMEASL